MIDFDPQNNLECKFVHQNQNLCIMDPLTPHNATPVYNDIQNSISGDPFLFAPLAPWLKTLGHYIDSIYSSI